MNNDDIKKFIDLTNLYTEVEVRKTENLEEGFLDWIKNIINPDDVDKVENAIGDLDSNVVNKLDDVADEIDTTVTTQAQANSILQNPDATDAQRKAAQDFYDENSEQAPEVQTDVQQPETPEVDDEQPLPAVEPAADEPAADEPAAGTENPKVAARDSGEAAITNKMDQDNAATGTGAGTATTNAPADDTPKITAEIQAELVKRGLDRGIIGEPLTPEDIAALAQPVPSASVGSDDADDATIATEPNTTFDSLGDARNADNLKDGDIITIDGIEAEVKDADGTDQQFFVHPGTLTPVDQPKPVAAQDELSATDTAQTGTDAGQTPGNATDDGGLGQRPAPAAQEPAAQEPAQPAAPSNGSLLGRKLDTTTPNLMKAYNDGGKQAMPTIRNMQTALSRLGFDPNGLDGKYGPGTFKAVQEFQKANGLSVDGQAGPSTMAAIKKALDDNFENNKVTPTDSPQAAAPSSDASGDPAETGSTGAQPRANSAVNTTGAAPTNQFASKDNNMNKNKINEASMNISMNGNDASEVADLVKLLQNAGMPQAGPVSDILMPMPKALPTPHDHDSHDNMKSMMTLMSEPDDAPCGEDCGCDSCATEDTSEYDAVVSEWDNSPEEEYSDISAVLPDGDDLHKSKKPYPAVAGGDNAMALESIKETLWAALQEKATVEGRGRGKKMKLKASRGNEDIKTTEGSRGKKSRGKKSRG